MTLPNKHDRRSASIGEDYRFNGVPCEVACYGSGDDYVCRITRHDAKPVAREWSDGYHPPSDAGMLWIRSIDGQCLITGFVQKRLFPNSRDLHDALDSIQQLLPVDQGQSKVNVTALSNSSIQTLEFNGEHVDTSYD